MISGERIFYIAYGILAVTGIVSIVMARRRITDEKIRTKMIIAFSLITLFGILMPICQKVYRWAPSAYTADQTGVTEGLHWKIMIFRHLASLGYLMEVVAVAIIVVLAKNMLSNQKADTVKVAEKPAEEVQ